MKRFPIIAVVTFLILASCAQASAEIQPVASGVDLGPAVGGPNVWFGRDLQGASAEANTIGLFQTGASPEAQLFSFANGDSLFPYMDLAATPRLMAAAFVKVDDCSSDDATDGTDECPAQSQLRVFGPGPGPGSTRLRMCAPARFEGSTQLVAAARSRVAWVYGPSGACRSNAAVHVRNMARPREADRTFRPTKGASVKALALTLRHIAWIEQYRSDRSRLVVRRVSNGRLLYKRTIESGTAALAISEDGKTAISYGRVVRRGAKPVCPNRIPIEWFSSNGRRHCTGLEGTDSMALDMKSDRLLVGIESGGSDSLVLARLSGKIVRKLADGFSSGIGGVDLDAQRIAWVFPGCVRRGIQTSPSLLYSAKWGELTQPAQMPRCD